MLPLNIAVFGANGGVGRQTVLQALNTGHNVTAIVRTPGKLTIEHPALEIVQGDVLLSGTLDKPLKNNDIVISVIGNNSLGRTTLFSQGVENLISAMKRTGTHRAYFISASGLEVNPTHSWPVRLATKYILQSLFRNLYADLGRMEKIIKGSNIDWTIVRPPRLLDGPGTGNYRTALDSFLHKGLAISRADLAHFIVQNLSNESVVKKRVEIAY